MLRVSCTECGVTVEKFSLKQQMSIQHGICIPQTRGVENKGEGLNTYVVYFPRVLQLVR